MDAIRVSAKTLADAITKACVDLGVTSEMIEYEVIETGTNGVLGFGAKPYVISVTLKEEETAAEPEAASEEPVPQQGGAESASIEKAKAFLSSVFEGMGMTVSLETAWNDAERELSIVLSGADMGVLIGKRGQTLDALQYLTSQVINKHENEYIRVKLDTENYRERRKETLETLAKNIAYKVKRTRRPVALEPMNPYERRIIHSVLQADKDVTTRSEGEEPYRHVVVCSTKKRRA